MKRKSLKRSYIFSLLFLGLALILPVNAMADSEVEENIVVSEDLGQDQDQVLDQEESSPGQEESNNTDVNQDSEAETSGLTSEEEPGSEEGQEEATGTSGDQESESETDEASDQEEADLEKDQEEEGTDTSEDQDSESETGEPADQEEEQSNSFTVSVISDTHILPTEMIGKNEDYKIAMESDRKLFTESIGLLEKAIEMIEDKGSQYIFLPGDMTKDGEYLGHEKLAQVLEDWKARGEGREVFLVPGNHDINCTNAYDYSGDEATPAKRTNHEEYIEIYGNLVYNNDYILSNYRETDYYQNYLAEVNEKYDRQEEYGPYAHGYTSYSARVDGKDQGKNCMTIIGLDTTKNTADTTSTGEDGHHETGGQLRSPLMSWLVDEVLKANERKDLVVLLAHHAFLPHFKHQDTFLSPYIIEEWDSPYQSQDERINGKTAKEIMAENDVKFLFTGHLHANDIAQYTDENGKNFYDIQTGATLTYPLPVRHIVFTNNIDSENPSVIANIETEFIKEFTYTDPETGQEVHVEDAQEYASGNQITPDLVANGAVSIISKYVDLDNLDINDKIFNLLEIPTENYGKALLPIISKLLPEEPLSVDIPRVGEVPINFSNESTDTEDKINIDIYKRMPFLIPNINIEMKLSDNSLEKSVDSVLNEASGAISTDFVRDSLNAIVEDMLSYVINQDQEPADHKTVSDLVNDAYRSYLRGDEVQPEYVTAFISKQENPETRVNLVGEMVNKAAGSINTAFNKFLENIEYKVLGDDNSNNEDFVRELLPYDMASRPTYYNTVTNYVANNFLGKNLKETIQEKNFSDMIAELVFGEDYQEGDKVQGIDLVRMALGSETVQGKINELVQSLGGDNLNQMIVEVVDAMTAEKVDGYDYFYHPGSTTKLVEPVSYQAEEDPVDETEDPVDETEDPVDETEDPVDETEDPLDETEAPVDETEDPVDDTEDPVVETAEPIRQVRDRSRPILMSYIEDFIYDLEGQRLIIEIMGAIPNGQYFLYLNDLELIEFEVDEFGNATIIIEMDQVLAPGLYILRLLNQNGVEVDHYLFRIGDLVAA